MSANRMSSDGFQCRFLWLMNQLLICFGSRPVIAARLTLSSSCAGRRRSHQHWPSHIKEFSYTEAVFYRRIWPAVVRVPPIHQSCPCILRQFPFLSLLQELGPKSTEATTVLLQKHFLQVMVSYAGAVLLTYVKHIGGLSRALFIIRGPHHLIWQIEI